MTITHKIPELFEEIIKNQYEIDDLIDAYYKGSIKTREEWISHGEKLRILGARKKELKAAAEQFLKWNTDKGNTA
jgi:hypothetical protein